MYSLVFILGFWANKDTQAIAGHFPAFSTSARLWLVAFSWQHLTFRAKENFRHSQTIQHSSVQKDPQIQKVQGKTTIVGENYFQFVTLIFDGGLQNCERNFPDIYRVGSRFHNFFRCCCFNVTLEGCEINWAGLNNFHSQTTPKTNILSFLNCQWRQRAKINDLLPIYWYFGECF